MAIVHDTLLQQQDLFSPERWPKRPYCASAKGEGLRIRSLRQALLCPYVQANPPYLRVWSLFDLDYPGAALAWERENLLPPAWAAITPSTAHAHLAWGLSAPVLVDSPDMRQAPMRYLCAVESLMREKLRADPGFSGLITKNPAFPGWKVYRGPRLAYDLAELAEYLPDLEKHRPRQGVQPERIGLGRNVALFDQLRHYAYRHIRRYKSDVRNFVLWQSHINGVGLSRNGDFRHPLDGREVWHIAKSVAKWTWRTFDLAASDARFSALQAHRGRLSGEVRHAASEDKRASARIMRANGMTFRAIADALDVGKSTVADWLSGEP